MILSALVSFTLLGLLMDYLILRRSVVRVKWARILYVAQALLFNIGVLIYLLAGIFFNISSMSSMMIVMLWVMLIFITGFGCKLLFLLFWLIQWAVERMCGYRGKLISRTGAVFVACAVAVVLYCTLYDTHQIRVEKVVITDPNLPEAFEGFTIAQFTDAHLGNLGSDRIIRKVVEQINQLDPDIVVQTGDLVNIHANELDSNFISIFKQIKAPVYSVFGNHDLGYYIKDPHMDPTQSVFDMVKKQQSMGWQLLRNESAWIVRPRHNDSLQRDSIALCGVNYPEDGRFGVRKNAYGGSDLRRTFEGRESAFTILLSHTPVLFDSLPMLGLTPALTISGHVHAMQAKVTIGERSFSPASLLYDKWSGLYNEHGCLLYINDGLGYVLYPMRVGTRPEITLYTFRRR